MNLVPDIIGAIYNNDAEHDTEGNITKSATARVGYHVNFPEEVPELAEYLVDPQPATPYRIYAGGVMPVCYRFPDEETFKLYCPELYPPEPVEEEGEESL